MLLYQSLAQDSLFQGMEKLISAAGAEKKDSKKQKKNRQSLCEKVAGGLIAKGEELGLSGNLWQGYLSWLLAGDENVFSLACERREASQELLRFALMDIEPVVRLFFADLRELDREYGTLWFTMLIDYVNRKTKTPLFATSIQKLTGSLRETSSVKNAEAFLGALRSYYEGNGVGEFGFYRAFRLELTGTNGVQLKPIPEPDEVRLSDLVGYELQKEKLLANTEAFVKRRAANNCLLFGPAGTGKSSSIKALLSEYKDQGLRILELYKHEMFALPKILEKLRGRNYRFIIFMDDLSFEDSETDYKYLKAVMEGGLEKKPDNVLIYATSNRRHLIRESFTDREEGENDLHKNDTVQEKLSLAYRFGITIYFGSPNQKEFQNIVRSLAERYAIDLPEAELFLEANRFELTHGGLSGRTAQAFIDYLRGRENTVE